MGSQDVSHTVFNGFSIICLIDEHAFNLWSPGRKIASTELVGKHSVFLLVKAGQKALAGLQIVPSEPTQLGRTKPRIETAVLQKRLPDLEFYQIPLRGAWLDDQVLF